MQILNRSEMKNIMGGEDCGCYSTYSTFRSECMATFFGQQQMDCVRETNNLEAMCHIDCSFLSQT
jgi:fluoride ion exporter CrcB/FEX